MQWNSMDCAPREEGKPILLLSRIHGVIEARWAPGEWSSEIPGICGREYSGPVWVCGDDQWQIEVEEGPDNYFHDGEAIGWLPRSALPEQPST
jgi:hypothetical protein